MKYIIVLLSLIYCHAGYTQGSSNVSIFHRLIVYNAENEIMLVKIKDTDIWVTPGFYQDSVQFIKKGLHDLANTYGMEISTPQLKGTFSMRRENGDKKEMLVRNIYHSNYLDGKVHFPENQSFEIGEIKWLQMQEANSVISFESMRMFIKQTDDYPNEVWGGSINVIREDNNWRYETAEDFYPLFKTNKQRKKRNKN